MVNVEKKPTMHAWRLFAQASIFAIGAVAGLAKGGEPVRPAADLLEQPAGMSSRASQSVLLAVTRAGERLVAVGEFGIVLLSDDDGKTWRQAAVPVSVALTNVRFASTGEGWAVGHGGVVLHSKDGGQTWVTQLDGKQAAQIELAAASAEAGEGAAARKRLREAERLVAEGADKPFLDVHFADESRGMVVGAYGLAFATRDGGKTWHSLKGRIDNPKGRHLYGIQGAGDDLYIAGEQGTLYRSRDGGTSFTEVKTPYVGSYFGTVSGASGELLVFGLRGHAYRSADKGLSWQKVDVGLPVGLTAGTRLADDSLVLVDETGRVLRSSDSGQSFQAMPVSQPSPFTGVVQAADGTLVVSGVRGISRLASKTNLAEHRQ